MMLQKIWTKRLLSYVAIGLLLWYTISAYLTAFYISEYEGAVWWPSTTASLFPIPYYSGGFMWIVRASSLDTFIYRYLLRIPLLPVIDVSVIWLLRRKLIKRHQFSALS